MSNRYVAKIGRHTIISNVPFNVMYGEDKTDNRYEAKIGGRTITSNVPFKVMHEEDDNQFRQESKKVYYRTKYDSPERRKLYDNEKTSYKQGVIQQQIPNQNYQFSKLFSNCDFRGSNIYFNYNK